MSIFITSRPGDIPIICFRVQIKGGSCILIKHDFSALSELYKIVYVIVNDLIAKRNTKQNVK